MINIFIVLVLLVISPANYFWKSHFWMLWKILLKKGRVSFYFDAWIFRILWLLKNKKIDGITFRKIMSLWLIQQTALFFMEEHWNSDRSNDLPKVAQIGKRRQSRHNDIELLIPGLVVYWFSTILSFYMNFRIIFSSHMIILIRNWG